MKTMRYRRCIQV